MIARRRKVICAACQACLENVRGPGPEVIEWRHGPCRHCLTIAPPGAKWGIFVDTDIGPVHVKFTSPRQITPEVEAEAKAWADQFAEAYEREVAKTEGMGVWLDEVSSEA